MISGTSRYPEWCLPQSSACDGGREITELNMFVNSVHRPEGSTDSWQSRFGVGLLAGSGIAGKDFAIDTVSQGALQWQVRPAND